MGEGHRVDGIQQGFRRSELKEALKTTRDDYGWAGYVNLPLFSNRIGPVHLYAAIENLWLG